MQLPVRLLAPYTTVTNLLALAAATECERSTQRGLLAEGAHTCGPRGQLLVARQGRTIQVLLAVITPEKKQVHAQRFQAQCLLLQRREQRCPAELGAVHGEKRQLFRQPG